MIFFGLSLELAKVERPHVKFWKEVYSAENSPPRAWDSIAEEMLLKADILLSAQQPPLSRCKLKSKRHGKLTIHFTADHPIIETVFRIIAFAISSVFKEQLQTCVRNLKLIKIDRENLMYWWDKIVLSEIKAKVPWQNENPSPESSLATLWRTNQIAFTKKFREQILCGRRICKCCWSGTIFHDEKHWWFWTSCSALSRIHSSTRWWIITTKRMDSGKHENWTFNTFNMALKFESGLWVKITLYLGSECPMERSNKRSILFKTTQKFLQIYLKNKRHSRVWKLLQSDQRQKQNSKPSTIPMNERKLIGVATSLEKSRQSHSTLSNNTTRRWRSSSILEDQELPSESSFTNTSLVWWSWKNAAQRCRTKRKYQCCTVNSGRILYLRTFEGHSGNNLIDPTLQDNVLIGIGIPYIYHVGCAVNLHSIINNGLVPGGQNFSKRQTVFFLPVDPRDGSHKDPEHVDFSVPRRAQYLHSAWKKHQDAVFWVDIDLGIREGLAFYQTKSNAIILQGTLPTHCILKVERLKIGEMLHDRRYLSPRPPPKISLRHDGKLV